MGLWRITKDGATIGHVATADGALDSPSAVMAKAELWGVVPLGHTHEYGAIPVPDDAIEDEARQRIRSIPDLAPYEEAAIAAAKRQTRAVDVLDHLSWLVWGNAAGVRHWVASGGTGMSMIEELRAKLAALDERIAAHVAECERTSGHAVNPDNEIGGMRNRSARGKARLLDRWDSQALESTRLVGERRILVNRIAWLEAAPVRDRQDVALLAWWDGLKAGDAIKIGNGTLAIKRKSAASVTLETGTRWTCQELTGLDRGRVAELRDLREQIEVS